MCDPATASLVIMGISGAMTAKYQYDKGQYEKKVAEQNAAFEEIAARDAKARGEQEAAKVAEQGRATLGEARASFGASGVDLGPTGSAAAAQEAIAGVTATNVETVRADAASQAWAHDVAAFNWRQQGKIAASTGNFAAASTLLNSTVTILGTGAQMGKWSLIPKNKGQSAPSKLYGRSWRGAQSFGSDFRWGW